MSLPFDGTLIETDALQPSSFDDIQTQLRCSRCTSGRTATIMTFYVSPNSPETQEGMYLRIKFCTSKHAGRIMHDIRQLTTLRCVRGYHRTNKDERRCESSEECAMRGARTG